MFDRLGQRDDETPFVVEWFVKNGIEVWSAVEGEQRFDNHVDKQRELADYQAETIKVIRGESRLDIDLLNDLVSKAKQEIQTLTATVDAAKLELEQHLTNSDLEQQEYEKIKDWADLYDTCTFAAKKMIISQFIKSIYVYRDYTLEIEFNVSFEDFRTMATECQEQGRSQQPWCMSRHKKADLQIASLPMVDDMGIEPTTSALRTLRSPGRSAKQCRNCIYNSVFLIKYSFRGGIRQERFSLPWPASPHPFRNAFRWSMARKNRPFIVMAITPRQKGRFHIAGLSQNIIV